MTPGKSRNIARVYEGKYKKNLLSGPQICHYCGMPARHMDHVPPLSKANCFSGPFFLVWACKECNYALNALPLATISDRCEFLKKKYERKYSKILKIPDWDEEELRDVSSSLRKYILKGISHRNSIRMRLHCLDSQIQTKTVIGATQIENE